MKKRKLRVQKLFISGIRRGEIRHADAYNARDAAREAVKLAKRGYSTKVTARSGHVKMTCEPDKSRPAAPQPKALWPIEVRGVKCAISPPFKKQIKGLAGF